MKTNCLLALCFCLFWAVSCSDDEVEPAFSIETEGEVELDSPAGSRATFGFTSAREWRAAIDADWVAVSPVSGEGGSFLLSLVASQLNDTKETRKATLTLTSGSLTRQIVVSQEAADYVSPEQDTYEIAAAGGSVDIRFTTNVPQSELSALLVTEQESWLVEGAEAKSAASYRISLSALANTSEKSRTALLYFTRGENMGSPVLAVVSIVQAAAEEHEPDYSADKTVRTLQAASSGKGIPVVLMGDGFRDTDIADGTYDKVMDKAFENLFSEEPLKSLKPYFDVYAVNAVSRSSVFGIGRTVFGCKLEGGGSTLISGNDETVQEYVACVEGVEIENALAVVILNTSEYAGTTYFGFWDTDASKYVDFAVAYCPVIYDIDSESFRQVLTHEAAGHGFAKLYDEYAYEENGTIPAKEMEKIRTLQSIGWAQNVDFTSNPEEVLWSTFLQDSRYAFENLGVYEGACTYVKGAYRPSKESMMNSNTTGFNAPSRKSIYDRVMKQGEGLQPAYEEFVAFDLPLAAQAQRQSRAQAPEAVRPFARPQLTHAKLLK